MFAMPVSLFRLTTIHFNVKQDIGIWFIRLNFVIKHSV